MILCNITCNDKLIERLQYLASSENLSHAYIFEGDSCADKVLIAKAFVKAILCEERKGQGCYQCITCSKIDQFVYEDLHFVGGEGEESSIKDEDIEELQNKLKKKPFAGNRNIAIIKNADTMTVRAQNRLLKTLEEPPEGTIIILLSENTENLVQTILSRCVVFRVNPLDTEENALVREQAETIVRMILNREPFYSLNIKLEEYVEDKTSAIKLIDSMEIIYRDFVCKRSKESRNYTSDEIYNAVRAIEEARRELNQGIKVSYTMKKLVIKLEDREW